jgi:hypothetical protein
MMGMASPGSEMAKIGITGVADHPYHSTSQAGPMRAYLKV